MNGVKRKVNGQKQKNKKVKAIEINDENIDTIFFESELNYHSTVTRMKVDALLYEVTLRENQRLEIDQFIETISDEIKSIPQGKVRPLSTIPSWLEKFNLKIPLEFYKLKKNFEFLPPTVVEKIGSFVNDSLLVKSSSNKYPIVVDLLVEIPRRCVHKKDYLNNEYLEKRAIYLCFLAKKLQQNSSRLLEFSNFNETTRNQPVLLVKPNEKEKFAVRIFLSAEENYLNEKRFLPSSSNLRLKWFEDKDDEDEQNFVPTTNYNNLNLFDCRLKSNSKFLNEKFPLNSQISNGLKLFKIWLEQRQISQGFGSFSGAMGAFLIAYLIHINKINRQMHSFQIFRIVLVALTERDFLPEQISSLNDEKSAEWKEKNPFENEECLLLDPSGLFNVFHTLTRENYRRLKHEAKISLNFFNDPVIDHFQVLFMTTIKTISTVDAIIQISQVDRYEKVLESKENKNELLMDNLNDKYFLIVRELVRLLNYGLNERVQLFFPLTSMDENQRTWSTNQPVPKRSTIKFGLFFSDQYDLNVLKGPQAGTESAKEFRRFWAERCELRRFADGSILEAVVWDIDLIRDKRLIWIDVCRFLLEIHGGISPSDISFVVNDQSSSNLLSIPTRLFPNYGSGDEQQIYLNRQFVELSKEIRTLNNELPTKISGIIGLDEAFRYTNVFPSLPTSFVADLHKIRSIEHENYALIPRSTSRYAPPFTQSLEILCQLDVSTANQPGFENFQRIQHSKIIFYVSLAKLIREKFRYISRPTNDCCYIEKGNYVYRLVASCHKEIFLLESQAGRKDGLQRNIQQTDLSKKLRYKFSFLPKITAAVYGVSQQFSHFSMVTRLFKRWLSSQMLLDHFDPINADLLCCYVFLHPAPNQPTKSIIGGFSRVLRLLVEFDWVHSPLIINFNQQLSSDDVFQIQQQFKDERSKLPAMCLITSIATHENQQPSVPILKRLIQLAKEALQHLEKNHSDSLKFLFRPSLQLYDAIIVLDPLQCPRAYQSIDHLTTEVTYTTRKKLTEDEIKQQTSISNSKKLLSVVDYDPVRCFLNELRSSFDRQAEFFHDNFGGLTICVLWKPAAQSNGTTTKVDYVQIIDQWKLLGTGLIKEVQTFPERWS